MYSIATFDHEPNEVNYKKEGVKEIPNTVNIPFDARGFDLPRMENMITSWKFRDGIKVLDHELLRYYTNQLIMGEDISADAREQFLLNEEGHFKEDVLVQMYGYAHHYNSLNKEESGIFNGILLKRGNRREEILKADLGISNKTFESFRAQFPEEYRKVRGTFLTFKQETLSDYPTNYPIYWDEDRFVHIYGRHYVDFFIHHSTYKGSHFQYTFKDIRRLVCLVLESLKDEIEVALAVGKPYAKFGEQGYYFNGNYYTLRISEEGRLMTFFPMA